MSRLLSCAAALLLVGCLAPAPPRGVWLPLDGVAAGPLWQPLETSCPAEHCAWAWWNVTLLTSEDAQLRLPLPLGPAATVEPSANPDDPPRMPWEFDAWLANVSSKGGYVAGAGALGGGIGLSVGIHGNAIVRSHALFVDAELPMDGAFAPVGRGETRIHVYGHVDEARVEFAATDGTCWRRAAYRMGAITTDAELPLRGEDATTCLER